MSTPDGRNIHPGGRNSNWRCPPVIRGVTPPVGGLTSSCRSHLQYGGFSPCVGGLTSSQRCITCTCLHWCMYKFQLSAGTRRGITGTQCHKGAPMFLCYFKEVEQIRGVRGPMHTFTDACAHSNHDGGPGKGWLGNTEVCTGSPVFPCNNAKAVEQTWDVRCTCIHLLIHVNILTKVWGQKRWLGHTHSATHGHSCFACNCAREVEHTWEARCTWWLGQQTFPHRGTHICM